MLEKVLKLVPNADADLIAVIMEQCECDFMAVCGRDDVPEAAFSVLAQMVMHRYSQIGAEGLASQSFSGTSESYLTDWPESLKRSMYAFRRLKTL